MKMKKEQLTKKKVMTMYNNVIELGYCEAQTLLKYRNRKGYTAGVYGWNADVYGFVNTAIVTGYRPFGNIRPDYDLVKEYEEKAKKIVTLNHDWNVIELEIDQLLKEFIVKVTE